ncbi:MAG: carboxypeptidase regulatory-like domain-containing protein [Spirochaetaceae bacterium]|nr:carboxypeptidase regulatory-like domain-containing protein [Spirochaetaceae bacterium]
MRTRFLRDAPPKLSFTSHLRLLPVLALALLLAGCGGDDEGGGAAAAAGSGTTSAEQPAAAAETDTNSASISGTVTFNGDAPEMAVLDMAADPICDEKNQENPRRRQVLVLGEGQTIANVMVQIKSASLPDMDHDTPDTVVEFDQGGCQYAPHVFGLRVGQTVKILNPDGTLHNVHAFSKVNAEFNEAMPQFRTELEKVFDKAEPTPFAIKCDVHPWMNAWAAVFDHPYFAVTGEDGKFTISGLPAGTYEVEIWHERLPAQTVSVTVGIGEKATVDAEMEVPSS